MINWFVIKKYAALIIGPMFSVVLFAIGSLFWGIIGGIGMMFAGMLLSLLIGVLLLKNPFNSMLEGKGILVLNIDSTGIISPFIVKVQSPYIRGKFFGQNVEDVFDRSAVAQLAIPKEESGQYKAMDDGGIQITLDQKEYNDGRFALFHYPVLLWNDQLKSIITKDSLSDFEKTTFAEHGVLYLNKKMEELTSVVRDFGRHVVELLKPEKSILKNKWVMIIIIIFVGLMVILLGPMVINGISGLMGNAGGAAQSAVQGAGSAAQAVTPIP